MKKYLLTLITLTFFLCEASFTGGMAFAATAISGTGLTWEYATIGTTKTLTITYSGSGSSEIPDYSATTRAPWYASYRTLFTKIVIGPGVTKIGNYAFNGCTALYSASFTNDLRTIGSYAFNGCGKFSSFTLPDSLETIMTHAFDSCTSISTFTMPLNVKIAGDNLFNRCKSLKKVVWNARNCTKYSSTSNFTESSCPFWNSSSVIRKQITDISFGNEVEVIPQNLCYNMDQLTKVTIPKDKKIKSIGTGAFKNCAKMTSFEIPSTVESIGNNVFHGCSLVSSITFQSENITLGTNICENCTTLTSIILPYALETIPANLLKGCTAIKNFEIPETVTSIANTAFNGCSSLEVIVANPSAAPALTSAMSGVTPSNVKLLVLSDESKTSYQSKSYWNQFDIDTEIGGDCGASGSNVTWTLDLLSGKLTISGSGAMKDYNTTANNRSPWYVYNSYIKDIVVSGISTIGNAAFANCDVETCTISASVTNLVTQCFFGAKVNELYYEGTLSQWCSITRGANNPHPVTQKFYINNSEISSLTVPSITSLIAKAFMNMKGITSVTIPATVTTIGADAFSGCSNIANVYYQGNLAQWCAINFSNDQEANPAFNGASLHITDSDIDSDVVVVKDAITSISNYAFCGVTNYTSIEINAATTLGAYTFRNCTAQILYRGSANGTSGNISWTWNNGVLTLTGTGAMNKYSSSGNSVAPWYPYLPSTHEIIIGENITSIGDYAFYQNTASSITLSLPSTLETIGTSAFSGLTYLREVIIPDAVTSIGTTAFSNCTHLEKIYCPVNKPTLVQPYNGKGNNFPSSANFYVPSTSYISQYAGQWTGYGFTSNWFVYGNCGASGDNVTFVYEVATETLTISGSGAMQTFGSAGVVPWYSYRSDIKAIEIESGVTTIGNYAFYGCNNELFTSISIPEGVTSIGNSAFQGCTHLASVTLPSTLLSIGSSAFHSNAFTSISIPSSVSTISSYAFKNCTNLESIVVPNITILNEETFYGCSSLGSVTLPNTLTSIKKNTFVNCSTLTSITIPEFVTEIVCVQGSGSATCPFSGCTSLTSVVWNARACGGFSRVGQYQEYAMPFESIKANIESFTFGANVTSIPSYVCHGMTGLTEIAIPASVTAIGANAFDGCTNIATVTSNATSIPAIASSTTFSSSVESAATLYVPATVAVRTAYSNDTYWSEFAHILPYILSFNMNGHGDEIDPICVNSGRVDDAQKPADPADADYHSFGGWYQEAGCSTPFTFGEFGTVVNADKTIYAKWTIYNYQVTFDLQGHGSAIAEQTIDHGGVVSEPSPAPTAVGYTFGGWYKEAGCSNAWDFSEDHITAATTLYAKWTINSYDVTFDLQGHGDAIDAQSVTYNSLASKPSDPSADYYTFGGWYKEAGCVNAWNFSEDHVTAATTLYAKWTIYNYQVTFDLQGHGSSIAAQTIDHDGLVTEPSDPSTAGYTFGGWYKEAGCANAWNFSTDHITEATTLYALWSENVYMFADTDDEENSKIVAADGKKATRVTIGRTIWKDGYYNSLCLPFSLTAEQIAASQLAGYKTLKRLSAATVTGEGAERILNVQLEPITEITAGEPCFISYEEGDNIDNPIFYDVTITASEAGSITKGDMTCYGTYYSTNLGTANTTLFLGENNTLYWPKEGKSTMKGLRAYFTVNTPSLAGLRVRLIDKPAEVPTGVEQTITNDQSPITNKIIIDNQLFIIRDGKTYNAQGALIK